MTVNKIMDKLWQDGNEFVSLDNLKKDSKNLYYNYNNMIEYVVSRGFLFNILNDTYYVKSQDEFNSVNNDNLKYSSLELISKALKFLDVENWYFGLYTALKFHDISFNNGNVDYLMFSNMIGAKPKITVSGQDCKFIRLESRLFKFGIIEKRNEVKYSDLEKTVLDLMYLWHTNNMPNHKIKSGILKYFKLGRIDTINEYCSHYPENIQQLVAEIIAGTII
jgi:hypothetical protein